MIFKCLQGAGEGGKETFARLAPLYITKSLQNLDDVAGLDMSDQILSGPSQHSSSDFD